MESDKLWKAAGRPKSGAIYTTRNTDRPKLAYRSAIRNNCRESERANDLHEALLNKRGTDFWKSWNSKFSTKSTCSPQVDSLVDSHEIATKVAQHFTVSCTHLTYEDSDKL